MYILHSDPLHIKFRVTRIQYMYSMSVFVSVAASYILSYVSIKSNAIIYSYSAHNLTYFELPYLQPYRKLC